MLEGKKQHDREMEKGRSRAASEKQPKKASLKDATLSRDPNEVKEPECRNLGKTTEAKGRTSAKALRRVCVLCLECSVA